MPSHKVISDKEAEVKCRILLLLLSLLLSLYNIVEQHGGLTSDLHNMTQKYIKAGESVGQSA